MSKSIKNLNYCSLLEAYHPWGGEVVWKAMVLAAAEGGAMAGAAMVQAAAEDVAMATEV